MNTTRRSSNAFERARDATLALDTGWWTSLQGANLGEFATSKPEYIWLGDNSTVLGPVIIDRRMLTYRADENGPEETVFVTRPVLTRFSPSPRPP